MILDESSVSIAIEQPIDHSRELKQIIMERSQVDRVGKVMFCQWC